MHERDRHHQTDGQTDTACTTAGRAMQASRGNKTGQGLMATIVVAQTSLRRRRTVLLTDNE